MKFKVGAPARVGLVAPNAVEVPAGGTGLDPSSTNFFQVLFSVTNMLVLLFVRFCEWIAWEFFDFAMVEPALC